MRVMKFLLLTTIVIGLIAYSVYHFGTQLVAGKMAETMTQQLATNEHTEAVKEVIANNPTLTGYMEEARVADVNDLPFTTMEDATQSLLKKIGVTTLHTLRVKAENGTLSQEEVIQLLQNKLTAEEQLAVKVLIYQEFYK